MEQKLATQRREAEERLRSEQQNELRKYQAHNASMHSFRDGGETSRTPGAAEFRHRILSSARLGDAKPHHAASARPGPTATVVQTASPVPTLQLQRLNSRPSTSLVQSNRQVQPQQTFQASPQSGSHMSAEVLNSLSRRLHRVEDLLSEVNKRQGSLVEIATQRQQEIAKLKAQAASSRTRARERPPTPPQAPPPVLISAQTCSFAKAPAPRDQQAKLTDAPSGMVRPLPNSVDEAALTQKRRARLVYARNLLSVMNMARPEEADRPTTADTERSSEETGPLGASAAIRVVQTLPSHPELVNNPFRGMFFWHEETRTLCLAEDQLDRYFVGDFNLFVLHCAAHIRLLRSNRGFAAVFDDDTSPEFVQEFFKCMKQCSSELFQHMHQRSLNKQTGAPESLGVVRDFGAYAFAPRRNSQLGDGGDPSFTAEASPTSHSGSPNRARSLTAASRLTRTQSMRGPELVGESPQPLQPDTEGFVNQSRINVGTWEAGSVSERISRFRAFERRQELPQYVAWLEKSCIETGEMDGAANAPGSAPLDETATATMNADALKFGRQQAIDQFGDSLRGRVEMLKNRIDNSDRRYITTVRMSKDANERVEAMTEAVAEKQTEYEELTIQYDIAAAQARGELDDDGDPIDISGLRSQESVQEELRTVQAMLNDARVAAVNAERDMMDTARLQQTMKQQLAEVEKLYEEFSKADAAGKAKMFEAEMERAAHRGRTDVKR